MPLFPSADWLAEFRDVVNASDAYADAAATWRWKSVVKKEIEPVKAMMQGKPKVRGDLPTIVRYVKASNVLTDLTTQLDTQFVDEQ